MTVTVNHAASVYAMQNPVLNRPIPSRSMQRLLSEVWNFFNFIYSEGMKD